MSLCVYVHFTSIFLPLFHLLLLFFSSAPETGLEVLHSHQKMLLPVVFLTRNRSRSVWNHPRKSQLSRELFSNFAGTEHWISDQGVKMAAVGGSRREGRQIPETHQPFFLSFPFSRHLRSQYEIRAAAHLPQVTQPHTGTNVNKQSATASPRSGSQALGSPFLP